MTSKLSQSSLASQEINSRSWHTLSNRETAARPDLAIKITSPRMDLLENLTPRETVTGSGVKPLTLIILELHLRWNIKMPLCYRVDPMYTVRAGQLKTTLMLKIMGCTEIKAKTGVACGRPRNGHKQDRQRQNDTFAMTPEIEAYRQVEDVTARNHTISHINIMSHKVISSIIKYKDCTTKASGSMKTVGMSMTSFPSRLRTTGPNRSTTIALVTARSSLTQPPNTPPSIPSKAKETQTKGEPLPGIRPIKVFDSRKDQYLGSTMIRPTSPDLNNINI